MHIRLKIAVLVCQASILLVAGCEKRIPPSDAIAIHHPADGEILYTLTSYTITWNPPVWPAVDITLVNGSGDEWPIGELLPNSGSYFWQIPADIPEATDYSVLISNGSNPGAGVRGGRFEIRSPGETSTFTDSRDGQTYRTVKIGTQWWMAENFRYAFDGSHYYQDSETNGRIYGRLYPQDAASLNPPSGWRLPTDEDWKQLEAYLGVPADEIDEFGERGRFAGLLLGRDGGTGFDALYGGYHNSCVGKDAHKNWESHFWTASKSAEGKPIIRLITQSNGGIVRMTTLCHGGCAVRYIK